MDDRHLSVDLLKAVQRGEKNPGDLAMLAIKHLFDECPRCRKAFEMWRRECGEGVEEALVNEYDAAFERVRQRLGKASDKAGDRSIESRIEKDRARADRLAMELLSLPRGKRTERIQSDRARFSGPLLADALLERGRGCLPGRPGDAYDAAGLARIVLQNGRPSVFVSELYARALAHQANARRIQGELLQSSEIFEIARFLLRVQGGGDRLIRAEIDSLEGSLRGAQRRFTEAQSLFSGAIMTYAIEGDSIDVAKTLLSLGVVYREMDDLDRAIEVTNQANDMFEDDDHPHLQLMARHNLVTFLVEAGQAEEAKDLFARTESLYARFTDPSSMLRKQWLEGHIARADQATEVAEAAYRTVREGFMGCGMGYDAALAALDLATLYAEQGRTADLKRVAEEIVPIFESQKVHREAAAALMLFRDAVRAEQITLGYVVELSRYLKRARVDPSLQFQIPT